MKRDYVATLWKEMPENANETPSSAESSDSFADLKKIHIIQKARFAGNCPAFVFWHYLP